MSVYKLVEIVGTSGTSVSDAIRGAVERASATLDDLQWFEVKEIRGRVKNGEVDEYQVKVDVSFLLHAPRAEARAKTSRAKPTRTAASRATRSQAAQVAAQRGQRRRFDLAKGFRKR
jgi:hypothetical protein